MKLSKENYNKAIGVLKRYNYNCINIKEANLYSVEAINYDFVPSKTNKINNIVLNKIIEKEDNVELRKSIEEYNIVQKVLSLISKESEKIFEEEFVKKNNKWKVIENLNLTESTYKRRKKELIDTTYKLLS